MEPSLISELDKEGLSLLALSFYKSNENLSLFLLDSKASVSSVDIYKRTPLHWGAFWGRTNLFKLLIDAKADLEAVDNDGLTPLLVAVSDRWASIGALLKLNANIFAKYNNLNSMIHRLAEDDFCVDERLKLISQLLRDIDVNSRNVYDVTPLYIAVKNDNVEVVDLLLTHGADAAIKSYGQPLFDIMKGKRCHAIIDRIRNNYDYFSQAPTEISKIIRVALPIAKIITHYAYDYNLICNELTMNDDGESPLHFNRQNAQRQENEDLGFSLPCTIL